jgi:hypothetical protein
MPNGAVVNVETAPYVDALRKRAAAPGAKPDKADAARIGELRSLVAPNEDAAPLAEDPRKAAAAILERSEFQYKPESPSTGNGWLERAAAAVQRWIENALRSFARWLDKLFNGRSAPRMKPLTGLEALAAFVKYLLIGVAVIGAVVGLTFLARRLYRDGGLDGLRRKKRGGGPIGPLDASEAELLDPLSSANSLAAQGDFRGAVRLAYIASLRRLSDAGLLTLERNRTNWEYQRALRSRSREGYDVLLPVTRLFDHVWYGRRPATRAEYESVVAAHDALPSSPPTPDADNPDGSAPR